MFRTVFAPNIRSSKLHIQQQAYCLLLYVRFWAPDDGWKDRPKHVECITSINNMRNRYIFWFYYRNILRYMVLWMSNLHPMTFAQRPNRLTTHFSERIPVVKRRMTVHCSWLYVLEFRRISLPLLGSDPRFLGHPVHSPVSIPTELTHSIFLVV